MSQSSWIYCALPAVYAIIFPLDSNAQDVYSLATPTNPPPAIDPNDTQSVEEDTNADDFYDDGPEIFAAPPPTPPAAGSGTALLPANEDGLQGLNIPTGPWILMVHGTASLNFTSHSGPRGAHKLYAPSLVMMGVVREPSWGKIQFRSLLSLDSMMGSHGYPNLFSTGEMANGHPLIDRQKANAFFQEISARVDYNLTSEARVFVYAASVGEPALGPSSSMHRLSAKYNPEAPITYEWFDNTHLRYGVVTAGISSTYFQFEGSAFRGSKSNSTRWGLENPKLDSWSFRASFAPSPAFLIQSSYGKIKNPEVHYPDHNEHRFTASAHYNNGIGFSAMLAFSNKKRHSPELKTQSLSAWLAEANWDVDARNTFFGRAENVQNDRLFPTLSSNLNNEVFRLSKFQLGYARKMRIGPAELAVGAALSAYDKPDALKASYGNNLFGYTLFSKITFGR